MQPYLTSSAALLIVAANLFGMFNFPSTWTNQVAAEAASNDTLHSNQCLLGLQACAYIVPILCRSLLQSESPGPGRSTPPGNSCGLYGSNPQPVLSVTTKLYQVPNQVGLNSQIHAPLLELLCYFGGCVISLLP